MSESNIKNIIRCWKMILVVFIITLISEKIGVIKIPIASGSIMFLPLLYCMIICLILALLKPIKIIGSKEDCDISDKIVVIGIAVFCAKVGVNSGAAIESVILAGPALILQELGNLGTIGQRYGATVKKHNLMNNLLDEIKKNPYGRRHIMNLWQEEDFKETDGLKPCAYETIWTVRGDYLDMSLTQRSSDFIVAGHINGMQYVALLMMVARHCGLKPGKFTHYIINLHLYDRHEDNAKLMIERESIDCEPKLILNPEKTDFYSFTIDDFELVGYESVKPQLKFELAI